jgi:zinc protease
LPSAQVRELPNGLKVAVIERRSLPLLTLRLVVKAGAGADPPLLPGTAQFTADLLSEGTSQRSARQIAETVDAIGGNLETRAEWDDSFVELTVLSDHTVLAFNLLADVVRHPTFPGEEIERKRQQTLSALEILRDDPAFTADTLFQRLVFSGTPYGHTLDGSEGSVRRIARSDVEAFHARHYQPANCILAAVGDITAEQAVAHAATYFGDWEGTPAPAPRTSPLPAPPSQRTIIVVDKPDAVQTEIRVGNLAIPRASDDYLALTVANQVLGGPAANRLFRTLRSRLGIAYGASSDLLCERTAGSWVAKTSTRTEETVRSLRAVIGEMEDLRGRRINAAELRTAQSYLTGHMALEFETSADVAEQTLELMVHNLPLDYWSRFQDRLSQLDADEVHAASRRYLDPEHCVIVLVGDARRFEGQLRKFGAYRIIRSQDLDLAAPDLVRPATEPSH